MRPEDESFSENAEIFSKLPSTFGGAYDLRCGRGQRVAACWRPRRSALSGILSTLPPARRRRGGSVCGGGGGVSGSSILLFDESLARSRSLGVRVGSVDLRSINDGCHD